MVQMNGEDELAKMRAEIAELRRSFNLFVRSQASLVAALRQAEESAQTRHRFLIGAIGDLRPLLLSEPSAEVTDKVVVTDKLMPLRKPGAKGEISGSFKVGGVTIEASGEGEHFKDLLVRSLRWILVILGMALTGGVGWLVGFLKQVGGPHK